MKLKVSPLRAAVASLILVAGVAAGQSYPGRSVTAVVASAPGAPDDVIMRIVAAQFGSRLTQNLIVENRPGAGNNIGAEYVAGLVPRGTHHYEQLIRPSELDAWGRQSGLRLESLRGGSYNPASRKFRLTEDTTVNYFAHFRAPAAP